VERAARLRRRVQEVAGQVADTEEYAASVLDRVADGRTEDAERLRDMAREAREFAARERRAAGRGDG
jgi:hypothetical protein